jgi:sec-independent protein translocase protein TatA
MEWGIILVIVLVIFGAGKLPQVGGNLGKAIRNFRSGVKDITAENEEKDQIEEKTPAQNESKEN